MQICKNLILALASFSTASRLWTHPTSRERSVFQSNSSSLNFKEFSFCYEEGYDFRC